MRERLDALTGFDQPGVDAAEWRLRYYSADERASMALDRAEHFGEVIKAIAEAHRASANNIRRFIADVVDGDEDYDYCPTCLIVLSSYGHCAGCNSRYDWADERVAASAPDDRSAER